MVLLGEQYFNRHSLAKLEYNSPTNDKRLIIKVADIKGSVETFAVYCFCGRDTERTHFVEFDVAHVDERQAARREHLLRVLGSN